MAKKDSTSKDSVPQKAGDKKDAPQPHWLFRYHEITVTLHPLTVLSLLVLLASIVFTWDNYSRETICEITRVNEEPITWITVPDPKVIKDYIKFDNGVFAYRHIYMNEFEEWFNVKPLDFPVMDAQISDLLENHDIPFLLRNSTELDQGAVDEIFRQTERYQPYLEGVRNNVLEGTYVDDGRVYIRWVNDVVRWGMFAGQDFKRGDVLGIYTGILTRQSQDLEYAWEFNYLVEVKDTNNETVRICVDGKYAGNYMRFSNHRDKNQNGDQLYVVFNKLWHVLYIAQTEIKAHEQVFVNYGQGYWENKEKYEF